MQAHKPFLTRAEMSNIGGSSNGYLTPISSVSSQEEVERSAMKKILSASAAILGGVSLSGGKGYITGYICGYGVGSIINALLEEGLPGYTNDPQLPSTVAEIAAYTGAAMQAVNGLTRSIFHAPDQTLSWRRFFIEVLR